MADLQPFEGRDVRGVGLRVVHAGDGLSKSLGVEPVAHELGTKLYVLIEGEISRIGHDPIPDSDDLRRVETFYAGVGTIVDAAFAGEMIAATKRKLLSAAGVLEIDFPQHDGDEPDTESP